MENISFSGMETDAIGEIMNISLGQSAAALTDLIGKEVQVKPPSVSVIGDLTTAAEIGKILPSIGGLSSFTEGLSGKCMILFGRESAGVLISQLMGDRPGKFSLDSKRKSAFTELINQMLGATVTAISEFLGVNVDIDVPETREIGEVSEINEFFGGEGIVSISFKIQAGDIIECDFLTLMEGKTLKDILAPLREQLAADDTLGELSKDDSLEDPEKEELTKEDLAKDLPKDHLPKNNLPKEEIKNVPEKEPYRELSSASRKFSEENQEKIKMSGEMAYQGQSQQDQDMTVEILNKMQQSQDAMLSLLKELTNERLRESSEEKPRKESQARARENMLIKPINSQTFPETEGDAEEDPENREMLMKVPLEISVEIGRTKKRIKDILEFTEGSLVVLDKLAGEQADLYVNGQCIARGDIVVVEDNFGIRITEILDKNIDTGLSL